MAASGSSILSTDPSAALYNIVYTTVVNNSKATPKKKTSLSDATSLFANYTIDQVNYRSPLGRTALVWAVQYSEHDMITALLDKGANPNVTGFANTISGPKNNSIVDMINTKQTPLHPSYQRILDMIAASASGPTASGARVSGPTAATPSAPTGIALYLLDYNGEQNTFPNNGIENSQIAVKVFKGPHIRSDQEPRDSSFTNPVTTGMKITWGTSGSATVLPGSFVGQNAEDNMVHNVIYINLDKAVDANAPVFYLQPASGGYRRKASKSRRAKSYRAKSRKARKSKHTKRR